jgi:predicted transcriptional regulator
MNKSKKDSTPAWKKLVKVNDDKQKETKKRNDYKSKLENYYDILKLINDGNMEQKEIVSKTKIDRSSLDILLDALIDRKLLLKKGKEENINIKLLIKGKNLF